MKEVGDVRRCSTRVERKQMPAVSFRSERKGTLEKLAIVAAGDSDAQRSKIFIIQLEHERENQRDQEKAGPSGLLSHN